MTNIRDEIVAARRERIAALGFDEGADLPAAREAPVVPFLGRNGLICEVKRKSPSKGDIAPGLDAVGQAGLYVSAGAGNLSVLTVPEGFGGSLRDLLAVKRAFPQAAVLRKDFLFDVRDVNAAWRAGADAVLLITGMLTAERLEEMYARAKSLGMEALVEVHDAEDVAKAERIRPGIVGINSRDLTTFRIDPLLPLRVRAWLDWPCRVVYESGISAADQAGFAVSSGFDGVLVGEGVVRRPALAGEILAAMGAAKPVRFWRGIAEKKKRPLVKICGVTNERDARLAVDLGADVLGFVFYAKSPRCASAAVLREIEDLDVLKVGVVVNEVPDGVKDLVDAVQYHGSETPNDVGALAYKAVRGAEEAEGFRCPRILLDAAAGGAGVRVDEGILSHWKKPLWLAGGIAPGNVAGIIEMWRPELIDLASGVEERPGIKSPELMKRLFAEIMTK